jgi:hypothetical protein
MKKSDNLMITSPTVRDRNNPPAMSELAARAPPDTHSPDHLLNGASFAPALAAMAKGTLIILLGLGLATQPALKTLWARLLDHNVPMKQPRREARLTGNTCLKKSTL